jgi:hypothetical protein
MWVGGGEPVQGAFQVVVEHPRGLVLPPERGVSRVEVEVPQAVLFEFEFVDDRRATNLEVVTVADIDLCPDYVHGRCAPTD